MKRLASIVSLFLAAAVSMPGVAQQPYPAKPIAPAMQDLIGGQIQLMFDNLASLMAQVRAWFGIFVPANTPRPIVERLHAEFTRALAVPDIREKMLNLGAEPVGDTPEQFAAYIRSEADKYARVIKASGAKAD